MPITETLVHARPPWCWLDRNRTYRTVRPRLERAVVAGLNGLNGNVLVTAKWRNNRRLVGKGDPVRRVGREETLEERGRGVKDSSTLTTDLHADSDLSEID